MTEFENFNTNTNSVFKTEKRKESLKYKAQFKSCAKNDFDVPFLGVEKSHFINSQNDLTSSVPTTGLVTPSIKRKTQ